MQGLNQMNSPKENRKNHVGGSLHRKLDSTDMQIIEELLGNAYISSTEIASKLKVPLSTIQRRRAILESIPILEHKYKLNPLSFGLRPVQFWVIVEGGKADEVAKHIFDKYDNVLNATIQMNALSNVGILAYFNNSEEIFWMLETIKSMKYVNRVEFAEIVSVIGERQANFFKIENQNSTPSTVRQIFPHKNS